MNLEDLNAILAAAGGGKWLLVSALIVGFLVRLLKVKPEIAAKIPPRVRPWLAVGLGVLAGVLHKVADGTSWTQALVGGALSGLVAVLGHEFVIESLLGGKEIGVKTPKPPNGSTGDPPAANGSAPESSSLQRTIFVASMIAVVFLIFSPGTRVHVGIGDPPASVAGCAAMKPIVKSVLDGAQIACVFGTELVDEEKVAEACGIARELIPIVRNLVGQRVAAKRAGVAWGRSGQDVASMPAPSTCAPAADAGPPGARW